MKGCMWKRISAYIIDIMIVSLIVTLFSKIEILNPYKDDITKLEGEYSKYVEKISEETDDISKLVNDTKIKDYIYDISKLQVPSSILNIVVSVGYFIVFQYFNKGRTIGKKLMKIKVKSINGDKPSFIQVMTRSLLINEILVAILTVSFISFASKDVYFGASKIIELFDMIIVFGSIAFIMFRNDERGIHDLIARTSVVFEDESVLDTNDSVSEEVKTDKEKTKVREAKVVKKTVKKNVKKDE